MKDGKKRYIIIDPEVMKEPIKTNPNTKTYVNISKNVIGLMEVALYLEIRRRFHATWGVNIISYSNEATSNV